MPEISGKVRAVSALDGEAGSMKTSPVSVSLTTIRSFDASGYVLRASISSLLCMGTTHMLLRIVRKYRHSNSKLSVEHSPLIVVPTLEGQLITTFILSIYEATAFNAIRSSTPSKSVIDSSYIAAYLDMMISGFPVNLHRRACH